MERDQPSDHCGNMAEQLEEMRRQLHDLRAKTQAPIQPPLNIVVQRDGRLRSFDWIGDVDAAAWWADAESVLRAQNLIGRGAADYVWCHLEGSAKKEVGCRPLEDCSLRAITLIFYISWSPRLRTILSRLFMADFLLVAVRCSCVVKPACCVYLVEPEVIWF